MRHWLQMIFQNLLPGRRLRRATRPGVLRIEQLEDRSVPAALWDDVNLAVSTALSGSNSMVPAEITVTQDGDSVSVTGLSDAGIDRLLAALQQLSPQSVVVVRFVVPPTAPAHTPSNPMFPPGEGVDAGPSAAEVTPRYEFGGYGGIRILPGSAPSAPPVPAAPGASTSSAGGVSAVAPAGGRGSSTGNTPLFLIAPAYDPTTRGDVPSRPAGPVAPTGLPPVDPTVRVEVPSGSGGLTATPPVPLEARDAGAGGAPTRFAELLAAYTPTEPLAVPGAGGDAPAPSRAPLADLSDGALLQRFADGREQPAFTALARRYEATVLRICTEVLGNADRALDASQATFQALARRAGALDRQGPIGGWLSTVAYHMALRYRVGDARRRQVERTAAERAEEREQTDPGADLAQEELRLAVREELDRMPEKHRLPLILHYINGRTHAEVAREVGLPLGSVARRIGDALGQLRDRLVARGFPF